LILKLSFEIDVLCNDKLISVEHSTATTFSESAKIFLFSLMFGGTKFQSLSSTVVQIGNPFIRH